MGIEGRGPTLEEAFVQTARAMFNLMVDVEKVQPLRMVSVECQGNDQAELLVEWLNCLLAEADIRRMAFSRFHVESLLKDRLRGKAWGEDFDARRHHPKTEVKAATYSMLSVGRDDDHYIARCVVDL
jgi:SHS2 domain-containing protein